MKNILWAAAIIMTLVVIITAKNKNRQIAPEIQLPGSFIVVPEIPACDETKTSIQKVKLPFLNNTWQLQTNCGLHNREDVTWSIITFYVKWKKHFGDVDDRVKRMINNITIEWDENTKIVGPIYDIRGDMLDISEVVGLCVSHNRVWVWVGKNKKISDSALIHELVHAALWVANNNPDADHEGDSEPGWTKKHTSFIYEVNKILEKTYHL